MFKKFTLLKRKIFKLKKNLLSLKKFNFGNYQLKRENKPWRRC